MAVSIAALLTMTGMASVSTAALAQPASASRSYDVPAGPLAQALNQVGRAAGVAISYDPSIVAGKTTRGLRGAFSPAQALERLLQGTALRAAPDGAGGFVIAVASRDPSAKQSAALRPRAARAPSRPAESPTEVEDIVVTAQRTRTGSKIDAPLVQIPQSVSVITRAEMDDRGVQNLSQAIRYTAGINESYGDLDGSRVDWIKVRGFDAVKYLDGLRLPNGVYGHDSPIIESYGLDSIAVLRGPSSGLYGAGGPGGLVDMVSKRPDAAAVREIQLQTGSFNRKQIAVDIGGPLDGDGRLVYRVVGLARDSDTQTDYTKDKRVFIAPSLAWHPSSNTTLTLLGYYQKDRPGMPLAWLPAEGTLLPNPNGRIPVNRLLSDPSFENYHRRYWAIGYELEHRLSDVWKLRQIVRYSDISMGLDSMITAGFVAGTNMRQVQRMSIAVDADSRTLAVDNQMQANFRTGVVQHELLVGVDYRDEKANHAQGAGDGGTIDLYAPVYSSSYLPPAETFVVRQRLGQTGIYAQHQMRLADWLLTLGGRYDFSRIRTTTGTGPVQTVKQTDENFTGRVGLSYQFASGLAPYVSYSTSFLPVPGAYATGEAFKPTTAVQIEAGIKYQPPGGQTLLTAAVYELKQKNVLKYDPTTFFPFQNGASRARGVELEARTRLTRSFDLIANYTYTDAKVTQSVDADLGKQLQHLPRHQAGVWGQYRVGEGALAGLNMGAGVRYLGKRYGDAYNLFPSPGVTLVDLSLAYDLGGLTPTLKGWRGALNLNNLSDKVYTTCEGSVNCYYSQGRTVQATLAYRW